MDDLLNSLKAFRKLSSKVKRELCAYCAAHAIDGYRLSANGNELSEYITTETKIDRSTYFRPTSQNYFKRLKLPVLIEVATDLLGETWVKDNAGLKRAQLAECLEKAVSGAAPAGSKLTQKELDCWMPKDF